MTLVEAQALLLGNDEDLIVAVFDYWQAKRQRYVSRLWFVAEACACQNYPSAVILQIFGVVLFSVFSVVNGFTKIKKTPKYEKHIERSRQHPRTPKFKRNRMLRDRSPPKF